MLAQSLLEQGAKLAETDPRGALKAFRGSYDVHPDFRVLYNIGKACTKIGDVPCATKAYEQYLKDGAAEIGKPRRKEVDAELKALAKMATTTITVKTSIKGADVQIDGSSVGKTPLDKPVVVREGPHKVVLTQAGSPPSERSVRVANGANETVELEPKKEEPTPVVHAVHAPPAAPPPPEAKKAEPIATRPVETQKPSPGSGFPIVPWAITGALAAGTVVSGVLMMNARADYNDKRELYPITRDELDAAHGKASDLFLLTTILAGATAVSAGVAAYFTVKRGSDGKETKVGLVVGPTGIVLTGKLP